MGKILISLLTVWWFSCPAQAGKPDRDDAVVLTWEEIEHIKFEKRDKYISELAKIFAQLPQEIALQRTPPAISWFLAEAQAAGDEYSDIRRSGRSCIYAGNISTYSRSSSGNIRCKPPTSIKSMCGMNLKCANPKDVPCNPLLFGFDGDNYANYFTGRVVTSDKTKNPPEFTVNGNGSGQSGQIPKSRIYEKPFCVPQSPTATKDCAAKKDAEKDHYYGVGYMMLDMKKAGCSPEKTWNEFADAAQKICDRTGNTRQAELSNKFTECDVIRERAQKLSQDYRSTDVGRGLQGEEIKGVR